MAQFQIWKTNNFELTSEALFDLSLSTSSSSPSLDKTYLLGKRLSEGRSEGDRQMILSAGVSSEVDWRLNDKNIIKFLIVFRTISETEISYNQERC